MDKQLNDAENSGKTYVFSGKEVKRFWSYVDKNGPIPNHCPELGPCWIWIGFCRDNGYGQCSINGHCYKAHRVAFVISGGIFSNGYSVLHSCHNRKCCNPAHLKSGTHLDNMEDMVKSGRNKNRMVAEQKKPILSKDAVFEIKEMLKANISIAQIARKFQKSRNQISAIKHQRAWCNAIPEHVLCESQNWP
jgi:hypothetical protein